MNYVITFIEGIITFISPCLLPLLPLYLSYFTANSFDIKKSYYIRNVLCFIIGFTFVFVLLGTFAGSLGKIFTSHDELFNVIMGGMMIVIGISYMDVLPHFLRPFPQIAFLNKVPFKISGTPGTSFLFGIFFSIAWTPCVGTFLGSALMLAASTKTEVHGSLLLLSFSIGLGLPFLISAILIKELTSLFSYIKQHYRQIKWISGAILILTGILLVSGKFGYYLRILS